MEHDVQFSGLQIGMFLGGLLMALVPITISIGIGIWALRQRARVGRSVPASNGAHQEGA